MSVLNDRRVSHAEKFCPEHVVKSSQALESPAKQKTAALVLPMRAGPKPAPDKLLRQIDSEAQAVAVSMQAAGAKLAYVAAALGRSESYVSLIRAGKRPVPQWFIKPFCHITGTLLLQQYIDLQAALASITQRETANDVVARLAQMLEQAA